jgi:bifunctional UDP-N-acetylglucosamine 2-epimerase / N-acetylmannosamine kinase
MRKRKICVVITARPSYSRVKTALIAIDKHPKLKLQLILAGSSLLQRYGDVSKIIEDDGFVVSEKIYNILEGESQNSMAKTTGLAIMELATAFANLKPDAVITIADRFETIATSIASSYQNIPLIHIQGGEVTGNIDEKVRHANTKLADIHFVASENARERVIKMGENPLKVFNTGCPSIDLAKIVAENPSLDFDPLAKYSGVGPDIKWKDGYIVVMHHPVTTEFNDSTKHVKSLLSVIDSLNVPTFWFWPNVDAGSDGTSSGIRQYREINNPENIHFFKNVEPNEFLKLIINSKCLIGNSSVGIRESSLLGIPVVNIGSRQNKRHRGKNVKDCAYDSASILKTIRQQLEYGKLYPPEFIYGDGNAGEKIAELLSDIELSFHKTIAY